MKIAFDFDETYTVHPALFDQWIRLGRRAGHSIYFVTWRRPDGHNEDIELAAAQLGIRIVYCSGKAKESCFDADIWIDDSPHAILKNANWYKGD